MYLFKTRFFFTKPLQRWWSSITGHLSVYRTCFGGEYLGKNSYLAEGFKHLLFSSRKIGEMIQIGWFNHQVDYLFWEGSNNTHVR